MQREADSIGLIGACGVVVVTQETGRAKKAVEVPVGQIFVEHARLASSRAAVGKRQGGGEHGLPVAAFDSDIIGELRLDWLIGRQPT